MSAWKSYKKTSKKSLEVLADVQDSYRVYHGNACFGADKYPLSLADEFNSFIKDIGVFFGMQPQESHNILVSYNSIFDETIRLNQRFFKDDIHAGGVPPRPQDIALHEEAMAAKRKQEMEAKRAAGEIGEEEIEKGEGEESQESESAAKETDAASSSLESNMARDASLAVSETTIEYLSPMAVENAKKKRPENRIPCLSGPFTVLKALADLVQELTVEKEDDDPSADVAVGDTDGDAAPAEDLSKKAAPIPHPECVFVRKIIVSLPLDKDGEDQLDDFDLYDYEKSLANAFIELDDDGKALLTGEGLNTEELYDYCAQRVSAIKERIAREEDPAVLRANVPCMFVPSTGKESAIMAKNVPTSERKAEGAEDGRESGTHVPCVLQLGIDTSLMQELVGAVRDSFVTSVEVEAEARLKVAESAKRRTSKNLLTNWRTDCVHIGLVAAV